MTHQAVTRVPDAAAARDVARQTFAADVRSGLSRRPRQLPSRYLYDPLGLALFDAICELPWYGLMRAERRLLAAHSTEVFERLPDLSDVIVLGAGNGEKLRSLLEARGPNLHPLTTHLIDFSKTALSRSTRTLATLRSIRIVRCRATYEHGLDETRGWTDAGRALVVFLGSNIGNCDPAESADLLRRIRDVLAPGGALLLGADLVKSEAALRLAYDDPLGVTAAFNRNLLVRINRELGADFDLRRFQHQMRWNAEQSRVEMHLVCSKGQDVYVTEAAARVRFEPGDSIWTESSYKYEPDRLVALLDASRLRTRAQWIDDQDRFALTLAEAV